MARRATGDSPVARAARAYARGEPVHHVPPSLRLFVLSRRVPGVLAGINVLDEAPELWLELETIGEIVAGEEAARQEREQRRSP